MSAVAIDAPAETPGLWRRMACFVYEGLLVFGVTFVFGLLYGVVTNQRNAQYGRSGLEAVVFAVLGIYFIWFWTHGGQTLAMKTWHIRLVDRHGLAVTPGRALARYLLSWMWFLPALMTLYGVGLRSVSMVSFTILAGIIGYALLALLNRERQFWHDAVCGTRLVSWRPAPRR